MTTDGFRLHEGALPARSCDALLRVLASTPRSRAGARHLLRHPAVAALAGRGALLDLARAWVGPGAVPFRATLFDKSSERNWSVVWHQDTALPLESRHADPAWGPWSLKEGVAYAHAPRWALDRVVALRVHLDEVGPANGPLRVLPGSPSAGVLSDDEVFALARSREAVDVVAGRGSVLAMHPLLVHASSRARSVRPRRVLHLEYASSLDLGGGIRLATA
jgi:ectoine hydroxylase-related dioxygenase (phytanoyl-CoA dioxygenase family)